MAYSLPSFQGLLDITVAVAKAALPTRNFGSDFSPGKRMLRAFVGAATDNNAHLRSVQRNSIPTKSSGQSLDDWLDVFAPGGLRTRKGATPARGENAGRVRGPVGHDVIEGWQLVHVSTGQVFRLGETTTVPAGGFIDVDIVGVSVGSATRLKKGEALKFISPPPGFALEMTVQLVADLDQDGYDIEQESAARNRLADSIREPEAGGNAADYVGWLEAQTGIAKGFCYGPRNGVGSVDLVALHAGSGTTRALSDGERAALETKIRALAPVTPGAVGGALRILKTVADGIGLEVLVTPDGQAQYAFDWDDRGGPAIVLSYEPTPRRLNFTAARPATMKAGDRIVVKGMASMQAGAPLVIESLSGSDSVILTEDLQVEPAATDRVYAGGPLTSIIRDALVAHIDGDRVFSGPDGPLPGRVAEANKQSTLNMTILAEGMGPANPDGKYGPWAGGLYLANVAKIVMYTPGVRNQVVSIPLTDQEAIDFNFPDYPFNDQVQVFVTSSVIVRRKP